VESFYLRCNKVFARSSFGVSERYLASINIRRSLTADVFEAVLSRLTRSEDRSKRSSHKRMVCAILPNTRRC